ncbi:MAG: LamG domain-containing protein, partial [Candidatus Neomarinimicrobiota bacterium]
MIKNKRLNFRLKTTLILLMILLTSVYINFPQQYNNSSSNSDGSRESKNDYDIPDQIIAPKLSEVSIEDWWNNSFTYRRLINITNPYDYGLVDYTVSVEFDYIEIVNEGKMNASLKDIRIVENRVVRNYYVEVDYPELGKATVWFETNISAGPNTLEQDTIMYYGNNSVGRGANYLNYNPTGVAWWRFEEGPGGPTDPQYGSNDPFTEDSIGNNFGVLKNMGDTDWVDPNKEGLGDYALDFTHDDDQYIALNMYFDSTETIAAFTATAWVKFDNNKGGWAILDFDRSEFFDFSAGKKGLKAPEDFVEFDTTAVDDDTDDWWGTQNIGDSQWHHVAVVFDSNVEYDKKIYVDGQLDRQRDAYDIGIEIGDNVGRDSRKDRWGFIGSSSDAKNFDGKRNGRHSFEGQIDEVRYFDYGLTATQIEHTFNYTQSLDVELNEEQGREVIITVNAIDLKGNYIPNVNISVFNFNFSATALASKIADAQGQVIFTNLNPTPVEYNFTVTMEATANPTLVETINTTSKAILFEDIISEINLTCNANTHIFNITDVDNKPVETGYVMVGTDSIGEIQKCDIDSNGKARFWWTNSTPYDYNYTVFYDRYSPKILSLISGDITDHNFKYIDVNTQLTTVNFTLRAEIGGAAFSGAKLNISEFTSGLNILNITTDVNGKATLRWLTTTELGDQYNIRIFFWLDQTFNSTNGGAPWVSSYAFSATAKKAYIFDMYIFDPSDYQTTLTLLNPVDNIGVDWGTNFVIRTLLNITKHPDGLSAEIATYADSMTYSVRIEESEIEEPELTGSMSQEDGYIGRHKGVIDTSQLNGGQTYTVNISAIKSGFTSPSDITLQLSVLKNYVVINQTSNDDSVTEVYWLEYANMSVNAYGENSEVFLIEDTIFEDDNQNFKFSLPDISTDWNLSQIVFNIYSVQHTVNREAIQLNITDPYGTLHEWDNNSVQNYEYYTASADNGTWTNLLINLNQRSLTDDNTFSFDIDGTFTGTVDVVAEAIFIRDKIDVEYWKFNVTDSITLLSDGNGWAIQNITFLIENCRDPSTGTPVNLVPDGTLNITTNEGLTYVLTDRGSGTGRLSIDDVTIYPIGKQFGQQMIDQYLFTIDNSTNLIFDVNIKVEWIQEFYQQRFLEINNITEVRQNFDQILDFEISFNGYDWSEQHVELLFSDIINTTGLNYVTPSTVGMTINIDGNWYTIEDDDEGAGYFSLSSLSGFTKDNLYSAYVQATQSVNFTVSYMIRYSRTVYYKVQGTISYEIINTPCSGIAQYNTALDSYNISIDTSLLDARYYNIRFTIDKNHYDETVVKYFDLNVLERLTLINGRNIYPLQQFSSIYVQTSALYTFSYVDAVYGTNITSLDEQSYHWKYDGEGSISPTSGFDYLTVNSENQYVLDFNTIIRPYGRYQFYIILDKQNYEDKMVIISLSIEKREIDYSLGDMFVDKQVSIVKGETITLEIELEDETTGQKL